MDVRVGHIAVIRTDWDPELVDVGVHGGREEEEVPRRLRVLEGRGESREDFGWGAHPGDGSTRDAVGEMGRTEASATPFQIADASMHDRPRDDARSTSPHRRRLLSSAFNLSKSFEADMCIALHKPH